MGVNVLRAMREHARAVFEMIKNKWHISNELSPDVALLAAAAACHDAETAMASTNDPHVRDALLRDAWVPAYAALCALPALTQDGLHIKLQALLTEHEDGASEWGADLRRTTRAALGLLCREHEGN